MGVINYTILEDWSDDFIGIHDRPNSDVETINRHNKQDDEIVLYNLDDSESFLSPEAALFEEDKVNVWVNETAINLVEVETVEMGNDDIQELETTYDDVGLDNLEEN